eukprot:TRINITY_DN7285_c0_g2_i1.p1 TRINITY_DN7285_c0_g2~~TRINITY_DN7285_c0_g2_i1.p1  ORF type:complete len:812 (-),score=239.44 TRINITY_DN7285_c0_g2_i1:113-2548(-)
MSSENTTPATSSTPATPVVAEGESAVKKEAELDSQFPPSFICPLTQEVMKDPVVDPEGNSYERSAIEAWLKNNATSPITRSPLTLDNLIPNRALHDAIVDKMTQLGLPVEELKQLSVKDKGKQPEEKGKEKVEEGTTTTTEAPVVPDDQLAINVIAKPLQTGGDDYEEALVLASIRPPIAKTRVPVDLVCVVDISGSMGSEATLKSETGKVESHGLSLLDITKHAVKTIIQALQPQDRLGLVIYHTEASVVFSFLCMDDSGKKRALEEVEKLKPEDSTNIWDGLFKGLEMCRKEGVPDHITALFLLTDGLPNISPPRGEVAMLKKYKDEHQNFSCTINSFGFGYSIDSKLLVDIANVGEGMYGFIPDSSFVGTVFVHALSNLLVTFAKNVQLAVEPLNGVLIVPNSIAGYAYQNTSWGVLVSLCTMQYHQTKDVVLKVKIPKSLGPNAPYIAATVKYIPFDANKTVENSVEGKLRNGQDEVLEQYYRLSFVDAIKNSMALGDAHNKIPEPIETLIAQIKQVQGNKNLETLLADLTGQVKEAFSKEEYYKKWGRHYMPSLARAHLLQQCNNFKDPGIQHYGGALFNQTRDVIDDIFVKLPPPKPSRPPVSQPSYSSSGARVAAPAPAPIRSMYAYHRSSAPCFDGNSIVKMANGEEKKVGLIKKNDMVLSLNGQPAKVLCVIKTHCANSKTHLVELEGGLRITPYHPVFVGDKWCFPLDLGEVKEMPCKAIYSFILESGHIMLINGVKCVSLGHNFHDDVVKHEYFGSKKVVDDLKKMAGWNVGLVEFSTAGCLRRDEQSGLVIGFYNEIKV